jgi:very-short-patch-repair endonuclease
MDGKTLQARARELRRNPAEPEVRLWRSLSRSRAGHKFRRQHVIPPYICDFFCPAKGLIVEIDGHTHDAERDARRDDAMRKIGYHTLRFSNLDFMLNIEGVIFRIAETLVALPDRWARDVPHPNPSPEGEGLSPSSRLPSEEGLLPSSPLPFRGGAGGGGHKHPPADEKAPLS